MEGDDKLQKTIIRRIEQEKVEERRRQEELLREERLARKQAMELKWRSRRKDGHPGRHYGGPVRGVDVVLGLVLEPGG